MLKSMRKNLKSLAPALWFVIAAFIISIFAVWGGSGQLGEGRGINVMATAGGKKISTDLYVSNLRQKLEALKRDFSELDSQFIQQLNIPQQVLEGLIQQSLLLQTAQDMGLRAMPDEVRKRIISYPVFQKNGKFVGFQEYKKILAWNHIPMTQFEEDLKTEILMNKVIQVLTAGISITKEELWDNYKKTQESARLEYVVFETDKVELDGEPSPEEIQAQFDRNKEDYRIPEKRAGAYVLFDTAELEKEIELTDSEIEGYYEDNSAQFEEPERIKVSRIFRPYTEETKEAVLTEVQGYIARLNDGEDFAAMAQLYSQDDKALGGGDWGEYSWKTLTPEEQDRINQMDEGEISPPLELSDGAAILKVTQKVPTRVKSLELVRDQISKILKGQKARDTANRRASELEKAAKREKSLDSAAQKLGYLVKNTGPLARGEAIQDIDPSGIFSQSLFDMADKGISSPFFTFKGVGLIQLERIEEPRDARLDEVSEQVMDDLILIKKKEKAREQLNTIKASLPRTSMETAAENLDLEYKTSEEHKRGQYLAVVGENTEVDTFAFSSPLESVSDPIEYSGGYALFRLIERKEVTAEDFEQSYDEEKTRQLEEKKNKLFASFMAKIREDKGVNIKYDLFFQINADILSRYEKEGSQ